MTATERDEMERVAKWIEKDITAPVYKCIQKALGRELSDGWPEWAEDAFGQAFAIALTDASIPAEVLAIIKKRLRTEPTCTG